MTINTLPTLIDESHGRYCGARDCEGGRVGEYACPNCEGKGWIPSFSIVFAPYSPRSWDGIRGDAHRYYGGGVVVPVVMEDELPPHDYFVRVSTSGTVLDDEGLDKINQKHCACVANGGITPQCIAMVNLALIIGCRLVNLQRDGATDMQIQHR